MSEEATPIVEAQPMTMGDVEARSNLEVERDKAEGTDMPEGFDPSALEKAQQSDKSSGKPDPDAAPSRDESTPPAEKPPVETPAETKPGDGLDLDWQPRGEKPAEHWKQLKQVLSQRDDEISSLKAAHIPTEEVAALRKERDEYRDLIRKTRIEHDPEFNNRFDVRKKSVIQSAIAAAGEKSGELEKLLQQPISEYRDERIAALMEDIPDGGRRRVNGALDILDRLDLERQSEIDAAAQNWDANQSRIVDDQRRAQEQEVSEVANTFTKTVEAWKGTGDNAHFLYQPDEGDPEIVNRQIQQAQGILEGGLAVPDRVKSALIIASYPRFTKEFQSVVSERNSLREQVSKLQGVQPGAGSSAGLSAAKSKQNSYGDDGFEENFVDALKAARGQDLQ